MLLLVVIVASATVTTGVALAGQTALGNPGSPAITGFSQQGAPAGTIVEYRLPSTVSTPSGIARGPDGNVWFTTEHGGMVGKVTPSGTFTLYSVAPSTSALGGIAAGPDGNIWLTDFTDARIERISTAGTNLALFPVRSNAGLSAIASGADGNVWVAESQASTISRISTAGSGYTTFPTLTAGAWPHGLNPGPDGNLWFAEIKAGKIGRIAPSGSIGEWAIPTANSNPRVIATGADGNLWFTEFVGNKIGRITSSGAVTEFPVPSASSNPVGIVQGPDGYVWFTEQAANKIGRIAMSGSVTEFPLPTAAAQPDKIVVGGDGNLWFTERTANKIGTIVSGPPASLAPANTIAPLVSGTPAQGQTLRATQGTWSGLPVPSYSYQWNRCDQTGSNCGAIPGATGNTYTLSGSDVGTRAAVQVTATNGTEPMSVSSAASAVISGPPVSVVPSISGASVASQTLSVVPGSWGGYPTPTLSYRWSRCDPLTGNCTPIAGANANTYVLTAADIGWSLEVSVTGANASGTATSTSPQTALVSRGAEAPVAAVPAFSGVAEVGQTLSVLPGVWGGYPVPALSYQWLRCDRLGTGCAPIAEAVASSYEPTAADVGSRLEVSVTGANASGIATAGTGVSPVVAGAPIPAVATVAGAAEVGHTLSVVPGSWGGYPAPTLSYQWQRCAVSSGICAPIPGAVGGTYVLATADVGETLDVSVTGANASGSATVSSAQTALVSEFAEAPTPAVPVIEGIAEEGRTLSALPGGWGGYPPPALSYQWLRCDQLGGSCVPIAQATETTYVLGAADVGSTLEVSVTGTNASGVATSSSVPTAVIIVAGEAPTPVVPVVSGVAEAGQTLSAASGVWGGSPAPVLSYQWLRCDQAGAGCVPIAQATESTYLLGSADVGSTFEVSVTGTNATGTATVGSGVGAVVSGPPAAAVPTVSGVTQEGQALSVQPGVWGGYPAPALSYRWLRCDQFGAGCASIEGASTSTYALGAADVGSTLEVSVTAANASGTATAASSLSPVVTSAVGPLTPVLDNFNRANNTGPPSVSWTHAGILNNTVKSNLYVVGNQATGVAGTDTDFWNAASFGASSETYVTVASTPTASGDLVALGLRMQSPASSTTSGYQGFYVRGAGASDEYKIVLRTNGTSDTALVTTTTGPRLLAGDRLLFRAIGPTLELWIYDSGTWSKVLSARNTAIASGGYAMLTTRNAVVRLDDFGGGTLP